MILILVLSASLFALACGTAPEAEEKSGASSNQQSETLAPALQKYVSANGSMEHLDTLYLPDNRVHQTNGAYVTRTIVDTLKIGGKKFSMFSNYNGEDMKPVVVSLEEEAVQTDKKALNK